MRIKLLGLAAVSAATVLLSGYTWVNGLVPWQYFGTPIGTQPYDLSNGGPTISEFTRTLPAGLPPLPSNLLSKVGYTLPEGRDIRLNTQGLIPDSDDKTNVVLTQESDVWVSFLTEGAGYQNSVGYFVYDPANPPKYPSDVADKILFANASMTVPMDTASSTHQDTVYLGKFQPGQAIGFFIVSNGFSMTGRTYNGKRIAGVNDRPDPKWVFYTLRTLNPEANNANHLNVHTVMLKDLSDSSPTYQRLVIGFEDINREVGGDHDFNDVVLAVHVNPRSAIGNIDTLGTLVSASDIDSDGDGVKDVLDEFPNDPTRAFSRYYPSKTGFGTLAYEDLWPAHGDYDMNDMVVRYRSREILSAQRQIVGLEINYRLDARGASIESGFGVELPSVLASAVSSATLTTPDGNTSNVTSEAGQTLATFRIFDSAIQQLPGTSTSCSFANTQAECPSVPTKSFTLTVNFAHPQTGTNLVAPYNPFIFRTADRGHEVHLPGKPGTSLVTPGLFGTVHDRSSPANGVTYVDSNGRPWALDLPNEWQYPNETIDLTLPYPNMATWASSAGAQFNNWYLSASVPKWLYITH